MTFKTPLFHLAVILSILLLSGAGCDLMKKKSPAEPETAAADTGENSSGKEKSLKKPALPDETADGSPLPTPRTFADFPPDTELPEAGASSVAVPGEESFYSPEMNSVFHNAASIGETSRGKTPDTPSAPYMPSANPLSMNGAQPVRAVSQTGSNDTGFITLIEDIEVPAQEAGQLVALNVREGESVQRGMQLAKIDDDQARMAVLVAEAKLRSAMRKAGNDVNIRYAKAAKDVAQAEQAAAEEANRKVKGTVTQAELNRLKLAVTQAELQIEQATHDFEVTQNDVDIQKTELAASRLGVQRRLIQAPVDGIVVERFRHQGEWVKPGDPLLRLIRMDVVRIKFKLDARDVPMSSVRGRNVTVQVPLLPGKVFQGKITFVNPVIEGGSRYAVWAEIQNQQADGMWMLQPGMPASAEVK